MTPALPSLRGRILLGEPLARYTSFRVGGPADYLVLPEGEDDIVAAVRWAATAGLPVAVLGNGTNVVVSDRGVRGVTIIVTRGLNFITVEGVSLTAGAGAPLMKVAFHAARAGLSGLEFAEGIPGTLGGAIFMNAGTLLGEVRDTLQDVRTVTLAGEVIVIPAADLGLEYRRSRLDDLRHVLLSAHFVLRPSTPGEVAGAMSRLRERRHATQPHWDRSAGCVFKNPPGASAGRMLDEAGAKGMREGGAAVSDRHANFVVNEGGASGADILRLMRRMRRLFQERYGILLQPEVEFVGQWDEAL